MGSLMAKGREDWPLEARIAEKAALVDAEDWKEIALRWRQKWRERRAYLVRSKLLEAKVGKLEERAVRRSEALREAKGQVATLNAQVTRLTKDVRQHERVAFETSNERKEMLKRIEEVSGVGAKEAAKASILIRSIAARLGIASSETPTGRRWESPRQLNVEELAARIDKKLVEYMQNAS